MECDSVHRSIEAKIKSQEIYLPSQYSALTKAARVHPKSYEAISLDYGFFTDFSKPEDQIHKCIRPGRKSGDPKWLTSVFLFTNPMEPFGTNLITMKLQNYYHSDSKYQKTPSIACRNCMIDVYRPQNESGRCCQELKNAI